MSNKSETGRKASKGPGNPYLFKTLVIPGRPLIEGSDRLVFPAFYRVEECPVTFRDPGAFRTREEREDYVFGWLDRVRTRPGVIMILIPHHIYSSEEHVIFHTGWTLVEDEGEIRTHQCVVFLAGAAIPLGRSDQGVICLAPCDDLSAWDGRTQEQSRALAA